MNDPRMAGMRPGSCSVPDRVPYAGTEMRGKILCIVHQKGSDPGRVGCLLMEMGYVIDVRCPCMGHRLPESMDGYDGVFVFGGPMSANDCHMGGIRTELDWIPKVLDSGKPYVGICLGAQMLARVLGGSVAEHPEGMVEIGYVDIEPTDAGRTYFDGPMTVYQWHREGFLLPESCTVLARSTVFQQQAFRYGANAYGVQFHPEVTLDMKKRWTSGAAHRLVLPGAQPAEAHIDNHPKYDPPLETWTRRFLERLLGAPGKAPALSLAG